MELEHVRRVLAEKAMGYEFSDSYLLHGVPGRFWLDDDYAIQCEAWQPDRKWQQCGKVIEAMREKGWTLSVNCPTIGAVWSEWWTLAEDTGDRHFWNGWGPTFQESVCYVAYQVLEGRVLIDDYARMKQ